MKRFALIFVAACSATPPAPAPDIPPPLLVIQPNGDDIAACARLGILGCPEAWPRNTTCVEAFSRMRTLSQDSAPDAGVVSISTCVANAVDIPAVRRCGDRSTFTVGCAGK